MGRLKNFSLKFPKLFFAEMVLGMVQTHHLQQVFTISEDLENLGINGLNHVNIMKHVMFMSIVRSRIILFYFGYTWCELQFVIRRCT